MTREEQPKFKQEFYGEWVTNPKYEIYSPTEFYLLLRNKAKDRPSLNLSEYKIGRASCRERVYVLV